jgi:hypothetical protein
MATDFGLAGDANWRVAVTADPRGALRKNSVRAGQISSNSALSGEAMVAYIDDFKLNVDRAGFHTLAAAFDSACG